MTHIVSQRRKQSHEVQKSDLWDAAARVETALKDKGCDSKTRWLLEDALGMVHNAIRLIGTEPNPGLVYGETAGEHIRNAKQLLMELMDLQDEPQHTEKEAQLLRAISARLDKAEWALGEGRRRPLRGNPMLAIVNPAETYQPRSLVGRRVMGGRLMGTAVYQIKYRHAQDGKDYVHDFERPGDVRLRILDDRTVVMLSSGRLIGMR